MPDPHSIQRCRFAEPTVFLANPLWAAAEEYPWSCHRDGAPRIVDDTAACHGCPRWEAAPRVIRRKAVSFLSR
jgi:hypothetical protein